MAKKPIQTSNRKSTTVSAPVTKISPVRNTPMPKTTGPTTAKKQVTHDLIARRAYYISISGNGGTEDENWLRAERELRAGL